MAYTTAGGTKKKVCYYYDGTATSQAFRRASGELAARLAQLAGAAVHSKPFVTSGLAS